MKYLHTYEKFINESFNLTSKQIDSRLMVIERQVLKNFSKNFWSLSLNSEVFTIDERVFIKEQLINYKIDSLNEGWLGDLTTNVWNTAKEKGEKIFNKIKEKIDLVKNNFKAFVSGITSFVKDIVNGFKKILVPTKDIIDKIKAKVKINPDKLKEKEVTAEMGQLKETTVWIKDKFVDVFNQKVNEKGTEAETSLEPELDIIEDLDESVDILKSFYIINEEVEYKQGDKVKYINKEGKEVEKEVNRVEGEYLFFIGQDGNEFKKNISDIKVDTTTDKVKDGAKKTTSFFLSWVVGMNETSPPEKGGKAKWWIKLILKIIALCLNWVDKLLTTLGDFLSKNLLKGVSFVSSKLKGPGPFEFTALGIIVTELVVIATSLFSIEEILTKGLDQTGKLVEILNIILPYVKEYVPTMETLEKILASFIVALSFYEIYHAVKDINAEEKIEAKPTINFNKVAPKINLKKG